MTGVNLCYKCKDKDTCKNPTIGTEPKITALCQMYKPMTDTCHASEKNKEK